MYSKWKKWTSLALAAALSIGAPSYAHADDLSPISSVFFSDSSAASASEEAVTKAQINARTGSNAAVPVESAAEGASADSLSNPVKDSHTDEETDSSSSSEASEEDQETIVSSDNTSTESVSADSSSDTGNSEEDSNSIDFSSLNFSSMRLVIGTSDAFLVSDDKAVVGSCDNVYLAQYDSEKETEKAYEKYYGKADFVEPDTGLCTAEDSSEGTANTMTEEPMTEKSNPMQELSAADNFSDAAADSADVVALIDTGSSSYTSGSVSMLGDDGADKNGHGTEMAKLITEEAGDASILSIKALNNVGDGTVSSVYAAIEYAISQNVKAINLSLSGHAMNDSAAIDQAIHDAVSAGILVVGAAGNNGRDASYFVPGRCTDAYIIGSCDKDGMRLSSSNYGDTVDYYITSGSTSEAAAKFTGNLVKSGFTVDDAVKAGGAFTRDGENLSTAEEKTEEKAEKNTKIQTADTPTHTHIWETKYDNTYHWQQCTVCGTIQNKETHEGHGLSNNGGVKTQSNNYNGRAYKESCTCGYESKLFFIILGSYDSYNGGDMSLHYAYHPVTSINDVQQVTEAQYESIKSSLPTMGAGYEWVDTDNDGYGWIFCKVALPTNYCHTGTIQSILGSEGDNGRKDARDEYFMLTRFLSRSSDTSLSALLKWLPTESQIPTNHCYYGYHEKYAKITETQWNTLKSYFTGLWCHYSGVGWSGMDICCSLQSHPGNSYISMGSCYDSATNQTGMSFTNGKAFTCDVCGSSATGWEGYQQDWYTCWSYHGVPKGKTITCGGHYLSSPNGNRAYAYDIITKQNNDNEDVTSLVHVKCFGENYISGCTASYKTIAANQDGKPTEIETTVPSTANKADSTTIGAGGNAYPVYANITGPVTINGTTKTITTTWGLGYTSLRIDEDAPVPYQYSDDQTANDYWKVSGNGNENKPSVQASVKVSFYDQKRYSKNIVYACCYDSDKKTVIPQGNGQTWIPMDAGNNDVWTVTLNLLAETNTLKDIYIQAKDATGNVSDLIPMKISFLDSKPPTVSASWDNAGWTKSKKLTITASDLSGQTFVGLSADDMLDIQKNPYNGKRIYTYTNDVYTPQTLTIYAQDSAGNLGQTTAILEKIDNTVPTITSVKQTSTDYHKASITVEANDINNSLKQSGSGVCKYGIAAASSADNITWVSGTSSAVFTVGTIGNYVVYAQDNAGNISVAKPFTVSSIKYGVTFNANGGSGTMARQDIPNNTGTALTKNTFVRTGYTFSGWNTAANGSGTSYKDGQTVTINSDITLYAQWTANKTRLHLDPEGGVNHIDGGQDYLNLMYDRSFYYVQGIPTKKGYTFEGYYTEKNGAGAKVYGSGIDPDYHPNDSTIYMIATPGTGYWKLTKTTECIWQYAGSTLTVYAHWVPNTYTIAFNGNGSTGGAMTDDESMTYDTTKALTANTFTRTGYTFSGWNTKADGSGTSYADKASVKNLAESGTVTLYAQWIPNTYSLSYTLDGGTASNPTSYNITSAAITLTNPTKTGYTFTGWSGTDLTGNANKTVTIVKGSIGNRNYTAHWTVNQYTVTCEDWFVDISDNRKVKLGSDTKKYNYGSTVSGADFGSNAGDSVYYSRYQYIKATSANVDTNGAVVYRYFYAYLDLNSVNAGSALGTDWVTGDSIWKASIVVDGYSAANASNVSDYYRPIPYGLKYTVTVKPNIGYYITNGQTEYTGTVTGGTSVNVDVSRINYTIGYNLYGGTNSSSNPLSYHIATADIKLSNPMRTGYTFAYWTLDGDTANTKYTANSVAIAQKSTGNKSFTAHWIPNSYTVAFDGNGSTGGAMTDESMTYDTAKALPVNTFTRKGYTFTGWNTKADGSGTSYADKASVENLAESGTVTLYAQWTANTYTVTIPTAISYSNMPTGNVNVTNTYDVSVDCKTGSFSDTIEVASTPSPMVSKSGKSSSLAVSSGSSKLPLSFTAAGTKHDQATITGTANTADVWTGTIQYTVTKK